MKLHDLRNFLVCALLFGAPTSLLAQPDYDDHYDTTVSGEAVVSVDVFYDQLTPYGAWVDDPGLGRVFTPESAEFVPYTVGHWQYTDVGFVWISSQPFDWATAHYGRWAFSRPFHRWVWLPDVQWGPSWVEWRQSGDYFGWAPLAPQVAIEIGYAPPAESWHYCNSAHVLDVNVTRYYEPPTRVIEIHRDARPIEHYAQISGARVVVGPSAAVLHERHVEARPVKLEAHAVGRWTPAESVAAGKRAEQRHTANEELNRKRIEANPVLRTKVAAVAPAKVKEPAPRPVVKEAPKQVKPEPRPVVKETPKPEPRPVVKETPKQVKPEPRPVVKETPKQVKPEPRPVVKETPKQVKPEPPKQVEPKQPPVKAEPRPEPRPAPKQVEPKQSPVKAEPRPEPRPAPKQVEPKQPPVKAEPRPEPRPVVKETPKQVEPKQPPVKAEPRPAPKPEPRTPEHKPNEK